MSPDGRRVFVTGSMAFDSTSTGPDYVTVAYDATGAVSGQAGTLLWVGRYNGPAYGWDMATSIAVDSSGYWVFVTGWSEGIKTGVDYATLAYDGVTGALKWVARYIGENERGGEDRAVKVVVSPGDHPFLPMVFVTGSSSDEYATLAYDGPSGKQVWEARYSGPEEASGAEALGLAVSPDGRRVFVTGFSYGSLTRRDVATLAYGASEGRQLWEARYNGPQNDHDGGSSLAVSPDSRRVFVTGWSENGFWGADEYATLAYDASSGAHRWEARYGPGDDEDWGSSVAVSPDGARVFVTGRSEGWGTSDDYATVAYDTGICPGGTYADGTVSGSAGRATTLLPEDLRPAAEQVNCDVFAGKASYPQGPTSSVAGLRGK
ncbi:MAG: hypothetical protein HY775_09415 [Acidobacteria bacterium]|nr:hypothetical protein [Acidobacteriota bacterium]